MQVEAKANRDQAIAREMLSSRVQLLRAGYTSAFAGELRDDMSKMGSIAKNPQLIVAAVDGFHRMIHHAGTEEE